MFELAKHQPAFTLLQKWQTFLSITYLFEVPEYCQLIPSKFVLSKALFSHIGKQNGFEKK